MDRSPPPPASIPSSQATVITHAEPPPTLKEQLANQITAGSQDEGFLSQLKSNPFFTAGFGLAALGTVAAVAQRGARQGAALIRRRLLVDIEINVHDESYQWFLHWMSRYQSAQLSNSTLLPSTSPEKTPGIVASIFRRLTPRPHHLSIQTSKVTHPNGAVNTHFTFVPGPGKHILRYKNSFLWIERARETRSRESRTGTPWETVTLTTLFSQRHVFEELFTEAHMLAMHSQEGKTLVYTAWNTDWKPFGQPRRKRPLESVILDQGVKERIVGDVKEFLQSGKWYLDRGIPYRRGYLLHGPPGSGKSSFIQALAGALDYNISLLNLSTKGLTDDRLDHLLTHVPARTIVLLEDVDAAFSNRRVQTDADGYRGANVTFSGLLNALDGVASAEERIIFLTTNHVERLDEALVRPGRVDMAVRFGEATRWQIGQLWERFYSEEDDPGRVGKERFLKKLEQLGLLQSSPGRESELSTAELQGLFLYNKGDIEGAIVTAEGLKS
ncbi:MAG: hypothetical protein M1835_005669 [Candelina submexicana]|nr:MAG: hypothetical protein M1835_005669 [Candelina submexicana]